PNGVSGRSGVTLNSFSVTVTAEFRVGLLSFSPHELNAITPQTAIRIPKMKRTRDRVAITLLLLGKCFYLNRSAASCNTWPRKWNKGIGIGRKKAQETQKQSCVSRRMILTADFTDRSDQKR